MGPKKRLTTQMSRPSTPAPPTASPMCHYLSGAATSTHLGPDSKMAAAMADMRGPGSPTLSAGSAEDTEVREALKLLPTRTDLEGLFARLEAKFDARFEELGADIKHLGGRVHDLEEDREAAMTKTQHLETLLSTQATQIASLFRWVDDLDNRGRRNNIRVRGLPEPPLGETENVTLTVQTLFNELLQRSPDTPLHLDRAHRALRARGAPNSAPRDVICRVHHFTLKEEVMKAARNMPSIVFDDHTVELFQDVSRSTLTARRELKPITDQLRARSIRYRWGYPFALHVRVDNRSLSISVPEDVPDFLQALELSPVNIQGWLGGDPNIPPPPQPQRQPWRTARRERRRPLDTARGAERSSTDPP
uniref:Uncharacterized protein n=1 Tax=Leptobrachium leishanense TaxID=445787 RepID=A0A8C5R5T1_9ANUR